MHLEYALLTWIVSKSKWVSVFSKAFDAAEDDELAKCKLVMEDMLWDTGSHGCTITADLLPQRFTNRLADPENNLYRDDSGDIVQV